MYTCKSLSYNKFKVVPIGYSTKVHILCRVTYNGKKDDLKNFTIITQL